LAHIRAIFNDVIVQCRSDQRTGLELRKKVKSISKIIWQVSLTMVAWPSGKIKSVKGRYSYL